MVTEETQKFFEKVKALFDTERVYHGAQTSEGVMVQAGQDNPERFKMFQDLFGNYVYTFTKETISEYTITHLTEVEALRFKAFSLEGEGFTCLVPNPN